MEDKSIRIEVLILKYGFYIGVLTLKRLVKEEKFELCHYVKKALDTFAKQDEKLTSKVDDISILKLNQYVLSDIKNKDLYENNVPHYVEEFYMELVFDEYKEELLRYAITIK